MQEDCTRSVSKSALSFFSGTFLSRISGMFRDVSMAFCFGSSPAIAAFMVAFRFANLFRRLIGEGPLPAGFIPHFEALRKQSPQEGARFFRDLFFSLFFFAAIVLCLVEGGLLMWYRLGDLEPSTQEIVRFILLMLPGVLFICLYGVSCALLQCERRFFLPGFAPVLFNVVWVAAVFFFQDSIPLKAMEGLSVAVIIGFFLQWLLLIPSMLRYFKEHLSGIEWIRCRLFSSDVRQIIKPFIWGIAGVASTQVNSALDAVFARYASLEGPAYLWYAIRIEQLPLALFGIALSSALLPPLSRAVCEQDWEKYRSLLSFAFKRSCSFMIPCVFALFTLGSAGVNLLYGRGDFTAHATQQTVFCLWGYGAGLLPAVFVLLLAPAFYAQKNFKQPMLASLFSIILNLGLTAFFVFGLKWGAISIALATSGCAVANYLLLWVFLQRKIGAISIGHAFLKTILSSSLAAVVAVAVGDVFGDATWQLLTGAEAAFSRNFSSQLMQFSVQSLSFGTCFLLMTWLLRDEEVLQLLSLRRRRRLEVRD